MDMFQWVIVVTEPGSLPKVFGPYNTAELAWKTLMVFFEQNLSEEQASHDNNLLFEVDEYASASIFHNDGDKHLIAQFSLSEMENLDFVVCQDTDENDVFTNLYEFKKTMLILKHYLWQRGMDMQFCNDGTWETECKEFFAALPVNEESLKTISEFFAKQVRDFRALYGEAAFKEYEGVDYTYYTDVFHGNKFWNEIPNDPITETALEHISKVVDSCNTVNEGCFSLVLYDFNDYEFCFGSLKSADDFINAHNCVPYTLFELKDNGWIELRCE